MVRSMKNNFPEPPFRFRRKQITAETEFTLIANELVEKVRNEYIPCLLYTSPSPRDRG